MTKSTTSKELFKASNYTDYEEFVWDTAQEILEPYHSESGATSEICFDADRWLEQHTFESMEQFIITHNIIDLTKG